PYESLAHNETGVLRMSAAVPITAQNTEVAQSVALEVLSTVGPDGIDMGIWPSQRRPVLQKNGRPRGVTCKLSTMTATILTNVSFMRVREYTTVVPTLVPTTPGSIRYSIMQPVPREERYPAW